MLDILFEHRNKSYGAYALRRTYDVRLAWALFSALVLITLLLLVFFFQGNGNGNHINYHGTTVTLGNAPTNKPDPLPLPKRPLASSTQATNTIRNLAPVIVPDRLIPLTDVPEYSDLQDAIPSDKTMHGDKPGVVNMNQGNGGNNNTGNSNNNTPPEFHPMQREAMFPGGNAAFAAFLSKNCATPDELEPGDKKMVVIRFQVDTLGSISKFEILQSGGERYDKIVMRGLSKMPRWIPAEQNGMKVAVYFTQTVSFVGLEQ